MKIESTGKALGATIEGLDLSRPVSDDAFRQVVHSLGEHGVIRFPDQQLTGQNLRDFSAQFGELEVNVANSYQSAPYTTRYPTTGPTSTGSSSAARSWQPNSHRRNKREGLMKTLKAYLVAATVCGTVFLGTAALAQSFPTKPIRIVVGFAAGGPTDVIARIIAQDMTAMWGQPVVVDNRTGANSLIATETVAQATPDGYTLLFASLSHNVNTILLPKVQYSPLKSFAPVSLVTVLPLLLVTKPDAPFNSVQELIKLAKAKPGEITYGSAGNGGSAHLAAALLETSSASKMTHVPFRGNAPALTEVIAGRVSFMFYPMIGIQEYVQSKRLKVLAAGTAKRHPDYSSVPTMAESGFPGFEDTAPWVGLLAPARTPEAVVSSLNDAVRKSIAKPESRKRLEALGAITIGNSPAEFTTFLQKDWDRWARVIKAAGVKAE